MQLSELAVHAQAASTWEGLRRMVQPEHPQAASREATQDQGSAAGQAPAQWPASPQHPAWRGAMPRSTFPLPAVRQEVTLASQQFSPHGLSSLQLLSVPLVPGSTASTPLLFPVRQPFVPGASNPSCISPGKARRHPNPEGCVKLKQREAGS